MSTTTFTTIVDSGFTAIGDYMGTLLPVIIPVAVGFAVVFAIWFWVRGTSRRKY